MTQPPFRIGNRVVAHDQDVYVVAELSGNHGNDLGKAIAIVEAAADAGADAVKIQTYTADTMTLASDATPFVVGGGTAWDGRRLYDLYEEASTPWEWHEPLRDAAYASGIELFSTAFDTTSVDFLEDLGVPVHKVASFELTDLALVERVAGTGKPLVLSTGMATAAEIDDAVRVARAAGAPSVLLLRCNSSYPADPAEMGLASIPHMAAVWGTPVGLSDHTLDPTAAIAAVALGACLLEKHLTLRRADGGPDAGFSLEPAELADTIRAVRTAKRAVGDVRFGPSASEKPSLAFRRSLFVVRPVPAGQALGPDDVRCIRPAGGLPPASLTQVLGRRAAVDLEPGTPLAWELLA